MVEAAEAAEENWAMRFHLTCENSNNPVPMDRLMKTSAEMEPKMRIELTTYALRERNLDLMHLVLSIDDSVLLSCKSKCTLGMSNVQCWHRRL